MQIKIKRLHPDAKLPTYGHPGDAGLDLYSLETYTLKPGESRMFSVGFALEFPEGFVALVKDKSSFAQRAIHCVGGVFDAGYRGEYNVGLVHLGSVPYTIEQGHKIAQLLIMPVEHALLEEVNELSTSARGDGRFGSTGK